MFMSIHAIFDDSFPVSCPPPGAVNVCRADAVEGPGGRWIPCTSAISGGVFLSCIFEVGPGKRQVCSATPPTPCAEEAMMRAIELAETAAA